MSVAVSPDGRTVYVASGRGNSVLVVDARTRTLGATIPVGQRPWGLALTRDGRKLYVANGRSDSVSVVATASRRVTAAVTVGSAPWGVAIAP